MNVCKMYKCCNSELVNLNVINLTKMHLNHVTLPKSFFLSFRNTTNYTKLFSHRQEKRGRPSFRTTTLGLYLISDVRQHTNLKFSQQNQNQI